MTITIYSKPACVQCNATYRALDRQGITYQVVDIEQDAQRARPWNPWAIARCRW